MGQSCGSGPSTMTWDSHVAVVYQPWPGTVMWQWSINHDLGQSCGSGLSTMTWDSHVAVVYQPWPGTVMWQWSINHDLGQSCGSGLSTMTWGSHVAVVHQPWPGAVMWQWSITNDSRRYHRCQTCTLQLITLTDMSWRWHVTRHTATNTTDRSIIYAVVRLTTSLYLHGSGGTVHMTAHKRGNGRRPHLVGMGRARGDPLKVMKLLCGYDSRCGSRITFPRSLTLRDRAVISSCSHSWSVACSSVSSRLVDSFITIVFFKSIKSKSIYCVKYSN